MSQKTVSPRFFGRAGKRTLNRTTQAPRNASLFTEIIVAITLIFVVAGRMNLGDFAVVLLVGLVVAGVGLVAFAVRKRFLFWCGVSGATFGGICSKPRFEVLFNPDADPADTAVIWYRMMGEVDLLCAFVGSMTGVAIACAISPFPWPLRVGWLTPRSGRHERVN